MTQTEENYLKAIYKLSENDAGPVSTNEISKELNTTAASVTDMLKKLKEKGAINYKKYKGVKLSETGFKIATEIVRKHRLWEVFLVDKLDFTWDKVHEIAEQLEHIDSTELVNKLDNFLGNPKYDPHGDPIPNAEGKFTLRNQVSLQECKIGEVGAMVGVKEHHPSFLQLLEKRGLLIGTHVEIFSKNEYDESMEISINHQPPTTLTKKICQNILIKREMY